MEMLFSSLGPLFHELCTYMKLTAWLHIKGAIDEAVKVIF